MAELNYTANPNNTNEGFELLPAGEYAAVITESEIKDTKTGTGKYLKLKWEIVDGPSKGRLIFENLNLWNQSAQAVAISQTAMNNICALAGFPEGVKDSSQLHNKPMILKVVVRGQNGAEQNHVSNHKSYTASRGGSGETKIGVMPWQK